MTPGGRIIGRYTSGTRLPCPAGQFFLDQARGSNFGEAFGADYAGFARLNFATPAAILREIVTRMGGALLLGAGILGRLAHGCLRG
jgi:hypothetical protein